MKILVLNCGSSSVKFQVFTAAGGAPEACTSVASGSVDKIGTDSASLRFQAAGAPPKLSTREVLDHSQALEMVLALVADRTAGQGEIAAVGHRVVHGGEHFTGSVLLDDRALEKIRDCVDLAPLHNPANLKGIQACARILPEVPQVAVFDTAFHHTIPPVAHLYALPYVLYTRHRVRRYGFHGTSHRYVHARVLEITRRADRQGLRVITAHLGNGCSLAAIRGGRSMDTSMGLTPLEGLVMGTRCGDLDPQVVLHVIAKEELTLAQASTMMNKHSGLLGLSGTSSDMRDLLAAEADGDRRARLAIEAFAYRLRKYVGAYAAALEGLDVLAFTGGIGTFAPRIRALAVAGLGFLGIEIDTVANEQAVRPDAETIVSAAAGRVEVMVIPTNEELVIARDTASLVGVGRPPRPPH